MRHTSTVMGLLAQIADVGRDPARGGYTRPGWSGAEATLRDWFTGEAARRSLDVTTDRNGIAWAWWNPNGLPLRDAVLAGSHVDSVPGGGAFDWPLGVASALVAVDLLRNRDVDPAHPLAIAVFPEEEGSRFGVACLGSRLLTGALDPRPRNRADRPRRRHARPGCRRARPRPRSPRTRRRGTRPHRHVRRAARGAGSGTRRARAARRDRLLDPRARPLAAHRHRPGHPRRHHLDGRPRRPRGAGARPDSDAEAGSEALAAVLTDLLSGGTDPWP
jgi:Peptidase family M28